MSRPVRSFIRIRSSPTAYQRPDLRHSSAGSATGITISWPSTRSISSRRSRSILCLTRMPSGRYSKIPEVTWRIRPALSISWWLTSSASAGASRSEWKNSLDIRMTNDSL